MNEPTPPPAGPIARLRQRVIEELLGEADYLLMVVNPGSPGVRLPEPLMRAGQPVPLHIGRRLAVPLPDLRLDEKGITATLSFQRIPFLCHLPWASIVQVSLGEEHLIWLTPGLVPVPAEPETEPQKPRLRLV